MTGWKERADQVMGTDTDLADFILNGPDTGAAGALKAEYQQTCDRFSNAPGWAGSLSDESFNSFADACEPYLEDAGYDIPVKVPPPFTGGQCPIQYSISYEIRTRTSRFSICNPFGDWTEGNSVVPSQAIFGPISGLDANQFSFPWAFGDMGQEWILSFNNSMGSPTTAPLNLNGSAGAAYASNCGPAVELRNFTVTPVSGVDDCGDLPDEIVPVDPAPDPGPSPAGDPGNNPDPNNPNDPVVPVPIVCGEGGTTCVTVEYTGQEPATYCGPGCLYWDCSAVDPEDPASYTFQLFDGDGNLLYENVAESCPNVELSQNIPEVGFVCTCPDWGRATSYNQTLFSPSVRLREWVQSNAGARADCKHIMAAKRIMGIEQPLYTDPPYSAPPGPSTPG